MRLPRHGGAARLSAVADEPERRPAVRPQAAVERTAMRASDDDRERVARVLHAAASEGRLTLDELQERLDTVYAARTYGELEPVLADLPDTGTPLVASPRRVSEEPEDTRVVVGFLSGPSRRGSWLVPRTQIAVAVMGGVTLDLREARFGTDEVTIQAYAMMGGVEIIVPDDLDVRVDGFGLMGGFDDTAAGGGDGTGPRVRVTGFAFWGGVDVKRKRRRPADD